MPLVSCQPNHRFNTTRHKNIASSLEMYHTFTRDRLSNQGARKNFGSQQNMPHFLCITGGGPWPKITPKYEAVLQAQSQLVVKGFAGIEAKTGIEAKMHLVSCQPNHRLNAIYDISIILLQDIYCQTMLQERILVLNRICHIFCV